jgi:putative hydrolase of the HAD superfamily
MKYKHILFDLDGTLWDFKSNSKDTLEDIYEKHTLSQKLNTDFETFHQQYYIINDVYWTRYGKGEITKDELRYGRFNQSFQYFGYENHELAKIINTEYISEAPYKTKLLEGCIEILEYLKTKYTLHIITNGFPEVQHIKLKNCGLLPYFQYLFISEEIGFNKPDARIFEHALKTINSQKEECLMVGDNWEADIIGAMNAGMDYVHLSDLSEGKSISKLEEIKAFL